MDMIYQLSSSGLLLLILGITINNAFRLGQMNGKQEALRKDVDKVMKNCPLCRSNRTDLQK